MPYDKANEYDAIYLWHKQMGSFPYYWTRLQERAADEGAPLDALYLSADGKWITLADLKPDHPFRTDYRDYLATKGEAP